jgi:FKBP-type peptidyl-prolyl cis-trans isomerase
MENKKNIMWVWILIVLIVIVGLVFITIKYKNNPPVAQNAPTVEEQQNTNMDNTQQGGGQVQITILKEGTGAVAKSGDTVAMNYTGTLTDSTVFDSNIDPKFNHVQPFVFTLGAGQVIPGWDQGIAGMKVGEQRKLEIPSELAYGATGAGNVIPPNANLTFTVELLEIK